MGQRGEYGMEKKDAKIIERINGARIITAVFNSEVHKNGELGWIDYVDDRWGKPRHRFAYINAKDWERETMLLHDEKGILKDGTRKIKESQYSTIHCLLDNALMNDEKLDIIVQRRQVTPKQQFDFLVKVDSVTAFIG